MGLDLSLNGTGVAILRFSSGQGSTPELHTIRPGKAPSPVTRQYAGLRLQAVVRRLKTLGVFDGTAIAGIEDYAYGISGNETNCVFQLGELGGAVRYELLQNGIPYIPVPIAVGKKFATGSGSAQKSLVAERMAILWNLPPFDKKQWDSSDALSMGTAAALKYLGELPGLKIFPFQKQLVSKLEVVGESENRNR